MPRKKKVVEQEDLIKTIALDCAAGKYGTYPDCKHRINGLGYGNIYTEVKKRVNLIVAGLLR